MGMTKLDGPYILCTRFRITLRFYHHIVPIETIYSVSFYSVKKSPLHGHPEFDSHSVPVSTCVNPPIDYYVTALHSMSHRINLFSISPLTHVQVGLIDSIVTHINLHAVSWNGSSVSRCNFLTSATIPTDESIKAFASLRIQLCMIVCRDHHHSVGLSIYMKCLWNPILVWITEMPRVRV